MRYFEFNNYSASLRYEARVRNYSTVGIFILCIKHAENGMTRLGKEMHANCCIKHAKNSMTRLWSLSRGLRLQKMRKTVWHAYEGLADIDIANKISTKKYTFDVFRIFWTSDFWFWLVRKFLNSKRWIYVFWWKYHRCSHGFQWFLKMFYACSFCNPMMSYPLFFVYNIKHGFQYFLDQFTFNLLSTLIHCSKSHHKMIKFKFSKDMFLFHKTNNCKYWIMYSKFVKKK